MEVSVDIALPANLPKQGDLYNQLCPARDIVKNISSLWGLTVLRSLTGGKAMRFGELRKQIEGISDKMLSSTLRSLERDGLLMRTHYKEERLRVDYRLTTLGVQCVELTNPLCIFIENNMNNIVRHQLKYDQNPTQTTWQNAQIN
jgi:DNA-binding HxlR family transcriptional regulator